eukprot:s3816_g8.t1
MAVEKRGKSWRARRKKDGRTFSGPLRATEAAANEDARRLDEAAAVSLERLQEVWESLTNSPLPSAVAKPLPSAVAKHGSGWRARVKVGDETASCPTRGSKADAEADARRLQVAQAISREEVHRVADQVQGLQHWGKKLSVAQFKLREQAAGFTYEPNGLLWDKELRDYLLPADQLTNGYMHCILCNGVMATVLTLLFNGLDGSMDVYSTLQGYLKFWHLPRAKNSKLLDLFSQKKKKANYRTG